MNWLVSLLTGPIVGGLLDAYKAKLASTNSTDAKSVELALGDLQAQAEARKQAVALAGVWFASVVQSAFASILLVYWFMIVIYDKVLGDWTHHNTDPIHGDGATWASLIIAFYFGGPIVSGVVNRVTARFGR